ncbi:MAG TPA: TGS domain-containing protein [archaeon]|nr:TGS domain-containing protein [archaeon]
MENQTETRLVKKYEETYGSKKNLEETLEFARKHSEQSNSMEAMPEIALILIDLKADEETVTAGLLALISEELLNSKDAQRKIQKSVIEIIKQKNTLEKALNFKPENTENSKRKLLIVLSSNQNVVFIILAENLVRLRHSGKKTESTENEIHTAKEIYSPLAHQIGLYNIGMEMDDIIFKLEEPKKYTETEKAITEALKKRNQDIEKTRKKLEGLLSNAKIEYKVSGRIKSIYSAYKKAQRKKIEVKKLTDLMALRVITETEKDCYEILGIVHSNWKPTLGEFDDYIARPKSNGYRSLHTAIISENENSIELQIRTKEMHDFAEYGIGSHFHYKDEKSREKYNKKLDWLKQVFEWQKETGEKTQADIFGKEIFALTPKGEIVELPEKATALDFAYAVHSDVGNRCQAIKINGSIAPINTELKTGDIVEVITSQKQTPKISWLGFVRTQKAKQKIRAGLHIYKTEAKPQKPYLEKIKISHRKIKLAKCCSPLPGDEIIGIKTTKRKISVHRTDCASVQKFSGEKLGVEWDSKSTYYDTRLIVKAKDRSGILKDILDVLTKHQVKVNSANAKIGSQTVVTCNFEVKLKDLKQFEELEKKIGEIKGVIRVARE